MIRELTIDLHAFADVWDRLRSSPVLTATIRVLPASDADRREQILRNLSTQELDALALKLRGRLGL